MKCWRCRGTIFTPDEDYGRRCVSCGTAQARCVWMPEPLTEAAGRTRCRPRLNVPQAARECKGCGAVILSQRGSEFCDNVCRMKHIRRERAVAQTAE